VQQSVTRSFFWERKTRSFWLFIVEKRSFQIAKLKEKKTVRLTGQSKIKIQTGRSKRQQSISQQNNNNTLDSQSQSQATQTTPNQITWAHISLKTQSIEHPGVVGDL
jgi:hypothetical protein